MTGSPIAGYRQLTTATYDKHTQMMRAAYPWASRTSKPRTDDHGRAVGDAVDVGFYMVAETSRHNRYGIYLPYHPDYPQGEPRAFVTPRPFPRPGEGAVPHVYADGSICVHAGYNPSTWTPLVGMTAARAWLEAYEDYHYDHADMAAWSEVPRHIRNRLR